MQDRADYLSPENTSKYGFLRCHVLLVFCHLLGCSFSSFLLFPLFSLISKYCYVPDLPSSTILTHSPGNLTQPHGFKSIHMLITSMLSPRTPDTPPLGGPNVCFNADVSNWISHNSCTLPTLTTHRSYLPQLMATPFLQMPRLKIIRAILDASFVLHIQILLAVSNPFSS